MSLSLKGSDRLISYFCKRAPLKGSLLDRLVPVNEAKKTCYHCYVTLGNQVKSFKIAAFETGSERDKLIAQCIFASGFFAFVSDVTFKNTARKLTSKGDLSLRKANTNPYHQLSEKSVLLRTDRLPQD